VEFISQSQLDEGLTDDAGLRILRTYVQNSYEFHRQKIYDVVSYHYNDWEKPHNNHMTRNSVVEFLGDSQYVAPTVQLAQLYSAYCGPTYLYSFGAPSVTRQDGVMQGGSLGAGGFGHGEELLYVFGAPITDGIDPFQFVYSKVDKLLSESVLSYWINFIRHG